MAGKQAGYEAGKQVALASVRLKDATRVGEPIELSSRATYSGGYDADYDRGYREGYDVGYREGLEKGKRAKPGWGVGFVLGFFLNLIGVIIAVVI